MQRKTEEVLQERTVTGSGLRILGCGRCQRKQRLSRLGVVRRRHSQGAEVPTMMLRSGSFAGGGQDDPRSDECVGAVGMTPESPRSMRQERVLLTGDCEIRLWRCYTARRFRDGISLRRRCQQDREGAVPFEEGEHWSRCVAMTWALGRKRPRGAGGVLFGKGQRPADG